MRGLVVWLGLFLGSFGGVQAAYKLVHNGKCSDQGAHAVVSKAYCYEAMWDLKLTQVFDTAASADAGGCFYNSATKSAKYQYGYNTGSCTTQQPCICSDVPQPCYNNLCIYFSFDLDYPRPNRMVDEQQMVLLLVPPGVISFEPAVHDQGWKSTARASGGVTTNNKEFTIALWLKLTSLPTVLANVVEHRGLKLEARAGDLTLTLLRDTVSTKISAGVWMHLVVAVKDATYMELYVSTSQLQTTPTAHKTITAALEGRTTFELGSTELDGLVDEFMVFNIAVQGSRVPSIACCGDDGEPFALDLLAPGVCPRCGTVTTTLSRSATMHSTPTKTIGASSPTATVQARTTPTDTALPTPTDTMILTPTDTMIHTATDTPLPTPTDTVLPAPTDTVLPTPTNTAQQQARSPTETAGPRTPTEIVRPRIPTETVRMSRTATPIDRESPAYKDSVRGSVSYMCPFECVGAIVEGVLEEKCIVEIADLEEGLECKVMLQGDDFTRGLQGNDIRWDTDAPQDPKHHGFKWYMTTSGDTGVIDISRGMVRNSSADVLVLRIGPIPKGRLVLLQDEKVFLHFDEQTVQSGVSPQKSTLEFFVKRQPLIDEKITTVTETTKQVVGVTSVLSGLSGGSAGGNVAKLAMLMGEMGLHCGQGGNGTVEEMMDWTMHPVGHKINGSIHIGALVWNALLMVGFMALHGVLTVLIEVLCPCEGERYNYQESGRWYKAAARVRFPSLVFIPAAFLFQGCTYAAMMLVYYHKGSGSVATGVFGLLMAVAFLVFVILLCSGRFFDARFVQEDTQQSKIVTFLFGNGDWISTRDYFVERWGELFDCFRPAFRRFLAMELGHMLPLTILAVRKVVGFDACATNSFLMAAILLCYFLSLVVPRPYISGLENAIMGLEAFMQMLAMVFLGVAFKSEELNHWGFNAAGRCFLTAMILMLIKTVYDVLRTLYELCTGHRQRVIRREEEKAALLECEEMYQKPVYTPLEREPSSPASPANIVLTCTPRSFPYSVGDVVRLHGLCALSAYNDTLATVVRLPESEHDRKVRVLTSTGVEIRVNNVNIEFPPARTSPVKSRQQSYSVVSTASHFDV